MTGKTCISKRTTKTAIPKAKQILNVLEYTMYACSVTYDILCGGNDDSFCSLKPARPHAKGLASRIHSAIVCDTFVSLRPAALNCLYSSSLRSQYFSNPKDLCNRCVRGQSIG